MVLHFGVYYQSFNFLEELNILAYLCVKKELENLYERVFKRQDISNYI